MEIYRYNINCQEYKAIKNSGLVGVERENAFNECVKKIGTKLSLSEYFNITDRIVKFGDDVHYKAIGKPNNILEELAYGELDYLSELSYCDLSERRPEDLTESRTDWETMKDYADGLASFIYKLKCEIANGRLKYE